MGKENRDCSVMFILGYIVYSTALSDLSPEWNWHLACIFLFRCCRWPSKQLCWALKRFPHYNAFEQQVWKDTSQDSPPNSFCTILLFNLKDNEIVFYFAEALQVLVDQSKKANSPLKGHERTVQYLQHLGEWSWFTFFAVGVVVYSIISCIKKNG